MIFNLYFLGVRKPRESLQQKFPVVCGRAIQWLLYIVKIKYGKCVWTIEKSQAYRSYTKSSIIQLQYIEADTTGSQHYVPYSEMFLTQGRPVLRYAVGEVVCNRGLLKRNVTTLSEISHGVRWRERRDVSNSGAPGITVRGKRGSM